MNNKKVNTIINGQIITLDSGVEYILTIDGEENVIHNMSLKEKNKLTKEFFEEFESDMTYLKKEYSKRHKKNPWGL